MPAPRATSTTIVISPAIAPSGEELPLSVLPSRFGVRHYLPTARPSAFGPATSIGPVVASHLLPGETPRRPSPMRPRAMRKGDAGARSIFRQSRRRPLADPLCLRQMNCVAAIRFWCRNSHFSQDRTHRPPCCRPFNDRRRLRRGGPAIDWFAMREPFPRARPPTWASRDHHRDRA